MDEISANQRVAALKSPQSSPRSSWRRILPWAGAAAIILAIIAYGGYYWVVARFLVSTDDAYIDADSVIISPKITGYISQVAVEDNQRVRAGTILARIDARDYQTSLTFAQGEVTAQHAAIEDLTQQIGEQRLEVRQANATVTADQAAVTYASQDYQRYRTLSRNGAGSVQNAQAANATIRQDLAVLNRDTEAVAAARQKIAVLAAQVAQARAVLTQLLAKAHQASLNLGYTTITTPIDGQVGVRTVRVGQYVQAGTELMAIVPLAQVYVTANYKETQLTNVQAGQSVQITVDTFPNAIVHGVVDSVAPASGEEFALLPPDNATGNFTKIVQRIPVKIRIDPRDVLIGRLRPGMSVEPVINTHPQA